MKKTLIIDSSFTPSGIDKKEYNPKFTPTVKDYRHKVRVIQNEEIEANRSGAYKYLFLDKDFGGI